VIRFADYLRLSTEDKQDPRLSFPSQHKANVLAAEREGGQWVVSFTDQEKGNKADRPGWAALIAEARSPDRRFDGVVVYNTSRLARDRVLASLFERELRKLDIKVVYAMGAGDTDTPEGQMFVGIQQVWDEYERSKLARETRRGMREGTSQGFRMGGRAPFGYRRLGTPVPEDHRGVQKARVRLVTEPDEAQVVREVFYLHGTSEWGLKRIAAHLNRPGGPPPPAHVDQKRNRGGHWSPTTLRAILRNHVYTGTLIWNRLDFSEARQNGGGPKLRMAEDWVITPDAHEAIADQATFDRSQARFGTRHSRQATGALTHTGQPARSYLFAGMVFCCSGHQPISMQGKSHKKAAHPTYNCGYGSAYSDNAAEEVHGGAKWVSVREDLLLSLVEDFYAERVFGPLRVEKLATQLNQAERDQTKASKLQATKLRTAISEADRKIKLQVIALEEGIEPELVKERIAELRSEKQAAEAALAALPAEQVQTEDAYLAKRLALLPDLSEQLRAASPETKRQTFQAFQTRIEFDKTSGRIGISVTVTEAVARAFADADGTLAVPVEDIAGAGFEPATFGL
jgi:site-specific DNA recombinase